MGDLDLGQVLRFKGMAEAAAEAVPDDGSSAHALADAYMRLHEQLTPLLAGELSDEFNAAFPEIDVPDQPQEHPRSAARAKVAREPAARLARTMLMKLSGWLGGLVEEETLTTRLRFEAEERARRDFASDG